MAKLSISTAWNEAAAFVKQQPGTLFLIAFGLMVLPGMILQFLLPQWMPAASMSTGTGAPPDPARMMAVLPWFFLAIIPLFLLSIWGHLTINMLVLRRESVIGDAFGHAARRLLPLLGAILLLTIAACILALPVVWIFVTGARGSHVGWGILLSFILLLAFIAFWTRLALVAPVAAAEQGGPIEIIRRSWGLTRGNFWRLLGFLILLGIVFFVVAMVVGAIGGILVALVAGPPLPGSGSGLALALLTGIVQTVWMMYLVTALARIYAQLSGGGVGVADVFE
jgi:hypothetical protein